MFFLVFLGNDVSLVFWRLRKFQFNKFLLWMQLFNNIGPNQNDWGLLSHFPVGIFGKGKEKRKEFSFESVASSFLCSHHQLVSCT